MKDKKLQVFVSSTFTDLILERQAAVEAILLSGHIPAGMELFSAGNESQMEVIKKYYCPTHPEETRDKAGKCL